MESVVADVLLATECGFLKGQGDASQDIIPALGAVPTLRATAESTAPLITA